MVSSQTVSDTGPPHAADQNSRPNETTPLLRTDPEDDILGVSISRSTSRQSVSYSKKGTDEEEADELQQREQDETEPKTNAGIAGIIAVLLLGCFIANADGSIVLATLGIISSETGNLNNGSWLVITFMLAVCAIQPTYGKLSDLYGRRSTLILAYTLFTIGCALCGAGQVFWQVALGRAIAGLGGAGMTSLVSVLIADKVPLREVATWRSYVNIASTVGRSAGGPIGGFLADKIGWRWSFYIQCPLTITAIVLVAWKLDGPPEEDGAKTSKEKLRRIDFLGSTSLALAIVGFLLILDIGGQKVPWRHPLVWILFGVASVFSIIFALVEAYVAREPIFPLRLIIHRDVLSAYIVTALLGAAQFGVMYSVPLYFQVTARATITNAGAHLVPAVCGNAIAGLLSGVIIKRTAAYKILTLVGCLSSCLSYILLTLLWHGETNNWQSLFIAPGGFGMGIVISTTFVYLAAGVDDSQMAIASTGLYLSANIGTLIGASLTNNILQTTLKAGLKKELRGWEGGMEIAERAIEDLEFVNGLEGRLRDLVVGCYVESFRYTHIMSLACAVTAFFIVLTWRVHKL